MNNNKIGDKIKSLYYYRQVFGSVAEVKKFRKLLKGHSEKKEGEVPVIANVPTRQTFYCRPGTTDAVVLWDTFRDKFHLPPESITSPKVILDLGANVGFTAVDFAIRYPNAKIILVEMDADNSRVARRNTEPWRDRCHLVNAAVWTADGEINYEGDEEWGFRIGDEETQAKVGSKTATARSIESLLQEFQIEKVDFLKMDIEGAEADVLKECSPWIAKVDCMKIELHAPDAYGQCEEILAGKGFKCNKDKHHDNCIVAIRK